MYHVLYDANNIFYIDVGSYDPCLYSVTKLLYDMKGAHGINIEPQNDLYKITMKERSRDINLCVGIGSEPGESPLYIQSGNSTVVKENACMGSCYETRIDITTLKDVCNLYVGQEDISFLKIDVEGAEKNVLLGANFQIYRPWIVVIESTLPNTMIPCYESWEYILLENAYHFVYSYGVNRYYVADEKGDLDGRFISMDEICARYKVLEASYEEV